MESYCGVQSLYRALRALGKEVSFADLVKPEYISSREGSTVADLKKAATDLGGFVEPMSRMTCAMLQQVRSPVILHVKVDLGSKDYPHWVLFMGTEGGKAKIYDGDLPAAKMDFDELAARWDGAGLLVSDAPINTTGIWLAALFPFLLYGGLATFGVGLLIRLERRRAAAQAKASWSGFVRTCIGQAAGLFIIALGAGAGYRAGSDHGYLSNPAAIHAIQDSHVGSFLPKIKAAEVAQLLDTPGVTIVDARIPNDYNAGHIRGAISVPVTSSPGQLEAAMLNVPKENRILVYSHSNGCPYGAMASRQLIALGYQNIQLYKGGWVEWKK